MTQTLPRSPLRPAGARANHPPLPFPRLPVQDIVCAALFAFFSMQGSIPGIAPASALELTGSPATSLTTFGGILTQALANALIIVLLLRHPRLVLRRLASVPWLALFALLAIASAAWSLDPFLTLRRSIPFSLAGLFGLWFAARYPIPRQLAILRLALLAVALATVAVVLFSPSVGLDHSSGHTADWQGVFTQKNACGRIMVLACAAVLFSERITRPRLAAFALFLFILVMSGSRAAWTIEAAILLLWLLLRFSRRAGARLRLVLALAAPPVALALTAAAVLFFPALARSLGRDPTLSGRTAVWLQVLHSIALRPLTGYGYAAFWRGMAGPSLQIAASLHFVVLHAHNGFLEIALELGLPGLALLLLSFLRAARKLWPLWLRGNIPAIAWPLAVLTLIALYDADENTLLLYNGLFWILCVAAFVTIEQLSGDLRHNSAAPPRVILSHLDAGLSRRAVTPEHAQPPAFARPASAEKP